MLGIVYYIVCKAVYHCGLGLAFGRTVTAELSQQLCAKLARLSEPPVYTVQVFRLRLAERPSPFIAAHPGSAAGDQS
jgi:hypothetical protein